MDSTSFDASSFITGIDATLTLNEYQEIAETTAIYPGRGTAMGYMYTSLGLAGEAGEIAEKAKKLMREEKKYHILSLISALLVEMKSEQADELFHPAGHPNHELIYLLSMYDTKVTIPEERRQALKMELGDVLWFIAMLSKEIGFSLQEIALANIEKLQMRKVNGTLHGNGDNR